MHFVVMGPTALCFLEHLYLMYCKMLPRRQKWRSFEVKEAQILTKRHFIFWSHPASSSPSCLLLRLRKNLCHGVVIFAVAEEMWRARVRASRRVRVLVGAEEDRV